MPIAQIFAKSGQDEYYGEPVTQLEHALQCAQLAEQAGADDETVVAAFLHDIGHLLPVESAEGYMDGYGTVDHERLGADFLRQRGYSEKIAQLIEHHVNAKRYLVFKHPEYRVRLSEASTKTLLFQGGPMTADEAAQFEKNPYFREILQVRGWDERAKEIDLPTPGIEHYLALCERVRR
ncbi:phosphonate degradation HD-domain oxygenase [Spirosoma rhododendri]|uniref:HD domain-containing protein n=1 Tax=Spirosoma rhododendri TaxID=2728024 RepID=A0A7L5DM24_9BACT|nr:phosphonate degradation HD-domain oxygenase [Spirosoma rhododendri]QJD79175.1 HD domain-containing protein [Spirosoma rhododendri]